MRSALWAVMCVLALFSMSCAGGADEIGGMAGSSGAAICGDGIVGGAEECEPTVPLGPTMTCTAMGLGSGMFICGSTCTFVNMCMQAVPVGGSGGGGNGG